MTSQDHTGILLVWERHAVLFLPLFPMLSLLHWTRDDGHSVYLLLLACSIPCPQVLLGKLQLMKTEVVILLMGFTDLSNQHPNTYYFCGPRSRDVSLHPFLSVGSQSRRGSSGTCPSGRSEASGTVNVGGVQAARVKPVLCSLDAC